MSQTVTVVIKGCGLESNSGGLSGLRVFEKKYEFDDPIEFGKFFGPKLVSNKVDIKENDLVIPYEAQYTWSVKRVEDSDPELYSKWSKEFSESNTVSGDIDREEVLLYWLQRTQDEDIIEALK